ncbi:putative colanic acid biosynthesis acetyltransferase WcaF [Wenyingzhuangia heitensis]|uniref:Colanic acid biosynthesis acetyltransferase WcaF n=1 Tax=Wenyingzhuangia heitensis TaxID=1487859 RepID=A0ABX0U643_9FLAO|nr:colanic acid biosynthesis acetyltransferase WcaF [Wenyingzhuangia heitensis]NIJ44314.1 putative colanic acid biosynthesis acetyltransferase WcaF [Wenyingzhuangia heitensis]
MESNNITYQDLKNYKYDLKRERSVYFIQLYKIIDLLLIKTTPKFLHSWRVFIYRMFGASIGEGVKISASAKLLYPWNITIGNHCWIGDNVELYSVDKIIIGNNVAFAHNIFVATAAHDVNKILFPTIKKRIVIKDEAWISSNVFINMGVTLNKGVVVGSASVVTKDLPEGYICVGNPAKPLKERKTK